MHALFTKKASETGLTTTVKCKLFDDKGAAVKQGDTIYEGWLEFASCQSETTAESKQTYVVLSKGRLVMYRGRGAVVDSLHQCAAPFILQNCTVQPCSHPQDTPSDGKKSSQAHAGQDEADGCGFVVRSYINSIRLCGASPSEALKWRDEIESCILPPRSTCGAPLPILWADWVYCGGAPITHQDQKGLEAVFLVLWGGQKPALAWYSNAVALTPSCLFPTSSTYIAVAKAPSKQSPSKQSPVLGSARVRVTISKQDKMFFFLFQQAARMSQLSELLPKDTGVRRSLGEATPPNAQLEPKGRDLDSASKFRQGPGEEVAGPSSSSSSHSMGSPPMSRKTLPGGFKLSADRGYDAGRSIANHPRDSPEFQEAMETLPESSDEFKTPDNSMTDSQGLKPARNISRVLTYSSEISDDGFFTARDEGDSAPTLDAHAEEGHVRRGDPDAKRRFIVRAVIAIVGVKLLTMLEVNHTNDRISKAKKTWKVAPPKKKEPVDPKKKASKLGNNNPLGRKPSGVQKQRRNFFQIWWDNTFGSK